MSLRDVLNRVEKLKPEKENQWNGLCPAHEDRVPSLSVGLGDDGKVLLHCQRGCTPDDVVTAMGLKLVDLFEEREEPPQRSTIVKTYAYHDEAGVLLYEVCRFEPKTFRQRRPDGAGGWVWSLKDVRRVLYRLPELAASTGPVWVVEGEKDADALAARGLNATTSVGGAGKWRAEYGEALRGRDVVILPDNDKPGEEHAEQVAAALKGVAASARIVKLPGLATKGDVSDWLKAGGTVERLRDLAGEPATFRPSTERLRGEEQQRHEEGARELSFGVDFLDDALGGIMPSDLILLGAKTGIGKTQLATIIALHTCSQGKRVHYFALEAEDREIERRVKFRVLSDLYYGNARARMDVTRTTIRYQDWRRGRLRAELGSFSAAADMEAGRIMRTLTTLYRKEAFTVEDVCAWLERIKDDTDLVVLDHLHYVDNDDENENRGYKTMVKKLRDASIRLGKPVVLVAHVRKGDRRNEALVPSIEDFHGSSDIPKIATKAVMLAPLYGTPTAAPFLCPTLIQIPKCRTDSSLVRYAALVTFNLRRNEYEPGYQLGKLTDGGKAFSPLPEAEMPDWAKGPR